MTTYVDEDVAAADKSMTCHLNPSAAAAAAAASASAYILLILSFA